MLKNKAFTLVEVAVVLTIIGMLSAGTLVGIKMVKNAKVTATVAQVQNYISATRSFYKTYKALPGDLEDASKRITGCKVTGTTIGCDLPKSGGEEKYKECSSTWKNKDLDPGNDDQCMNALEILCGAQDSASICASKENEAADTCNGEVAACDAQVVTQADVDSANTTAQAVCDVVEDGVVSDCASEIADNDAACAYASPLGRVIPPPLLTQCQNDPGVIYICPEGYLNYQDGDCWLPDFSGSIAATSEPATVQSCVEGKGYDYQSIGECQGDIANINPDYPYFSGGEATCLGDKYDGGQCLADNGGYADIAAYITANGGYADTASCLAPSGYTDYNGCLVDTREYPDDATCIAALDAEADLSEICYDQFNGDDEQYFVVKSRTVYPEGQIGDGVIGRISWDMVEYVGEEVIGADEWNIANAVDAETILFWYELKQAGLVSGVTDAGINRMTYQPIFGETHPYSEIGGGFWVGHSDGCCGVQPSPDDPVSSGSTIHTGRPWQAGNFTLNGNILVLTKFSKGAAEPASDILKFQCSEDLAAGSWSCDYKNSTGYMLNHVSTDNIISPIDAKKIDLKLDDGYPDTGSVQAYGDIFSCYRIEGDDFIYSETVTSRHCGLYIKITD